MMINAVNLPPGVTVLSVAQLTNQVKGMLEPRFASVWVCGQVSDFKKPSSGHWYFKLREGQAAVLNAVMFRSSNLRSRFDPKDGMEVIARGRLTVYPPQGNYQLQVEALHATGIGAHELALRQLKEKLFNKGYFAPERKRQLPRFARRIAVVTSSSGAAVRDILEILQRRWPAVEVWVCPVRVQGEGAPREIAAALALLNRFDGTDAIILGRGGGSAEDLDAFNDERVADAIYHSRVPVVSAVGHEIDITIADLVADVRALTPSEAAEKVVPDRTDLLKIIAEMHGRLGSLLTGRLDSATRRLAAVLQRPVFRRPLDRIQELEQRLDVLGERLQRAARLRLEQARQRADSAAGRLQSLSPLNVLGRGYSLTRRAHDGVVVRSVQQVQPGALLVTVVGDGQFSSRVEERAAIT
jgi:exodeoxyribonuclease VII large subunit